MLFLVLRLLLAAVFAVAALAKLRDREGTATTLGEFGVPARLRTVGAVALPVAELVAAGLLIPHSTARIGALLALALLLVFVAVVGRALARGERPDCNCFGGLSSTPVGRWTLIRNLVLAALAGSVALAGPGESLAALDGSTVLAIAGGLAGLLLLGLVGFTWQLFQQNGRLVERMRTLEEVTGLAEPDKPFGGGLPVGELAPDLVLAGADGSARPLSGMVGRGTAVALVFGDPNCGGCREVAARLPGLKERLAGVVVPVLVSRHGADYEPEVTAAIEVLLQRDREALAAFRVAAVPALVLVDAEGRIASEPAIGERAVGETLDSLGEAVAPADTDLELIAVGGAR